MRFPVVCVYQDKFLRRYSCTNGLSAWRFAAFMETAYVRKIRNNLWFVSVYGMRSS